MRRAGRLVWGDALLLEGDIAGIFDDPACFDGAAAFATMILAPAGRDPQGFLREVWEVRRDGKLVWGDALHLEGDIAGIIDDPACFDGAAAFATMILAPAGRDPRGFLDCAWKVQSASATDVVRSGVTVIAGLVVARWLAADAAALRRAYADLASRLRCDAMGLPPGLPRLWHV